MQDLLEFNEAITPKGHVKVELMNDRGKVVERQEGHNFISKLWAITAYSWQRYAWGYYAYNLTTTENNINSLGSVSPITFPNHHIACWNDSSAESPTTEHMLRPDGQGIVAYSPKFNVPINTGRRGMVNTTTSSWNDSSESMIYDWVTTAGNGTFQSVGYTSIQGGGDKGLHLIRPSPYDRKYVRVNATALSVFGNASYNSTGRFTAVDSSGTMILPIMLQTGAFSLGLLEIGPSEWNAGMTPNVFGASVKDVSYTATGGLQPGGVGVWYAPCFAGEYGGYWWFICAAYSGNPRIFRVHKTTKAIDKVFTLPDGGSNVHSGVVLGSDMYIVNGTATDPSIRRVDLVGGTPSITATINPTYGNFTGTYGSITTDGTDLYLDGTTILKINTSGTILQVLGKFLSTMQDEGSGARTPGLGVGEAGTTNARFNTSFSSFSGDATAYGVHQRSGYASLFWANGVLNTQGSAYINNAYTISVAEVGFNLGSRILLPSPMTKTSSQTMKITYTVTMPSRPNF